MPHLLVIQPGAAVAAVDTGTRLAGRSPISQPHHTRHIFSCFFNHFVSVFHVYFVSVFLCVCVFSSLLVSLSLFLFCLGSNCKLSCADDPSISCCPLFTLFTSPLTVVYIHKGTDQLVLSLLTVDGLY